MWFHSHGAAAAYLWDRLSFLPTGMPLAPHQALDRAGVSALAQPAARKTIPVPAMHAFTRVPNPSTRLTAVPPERANTTAMQLVRKQPGLPRVPLRTIHCWAPGLPTAPQGGIPKGCLLLAGLRSPPRAPRGVLPIESGPFGGGILAGAGATPAGRGLPRGDCPSPSEPSGLRDRRRRGD